MPSRTTTATWRAVAERRGLPLLPHWVIVPDVQTGAETPIFSRQADKLFREDEKRDLIDFLAANPLAGTRLPALAGCAR